jgi:NADH dehydrogenase FAD-containing subunit
VVQPLVWLGGSARYPSRVAAHVVVLGAGFGGLELSTRLSESLRERVRVTLIDQSDSFVFGFTKLDVMFGHVELDSVRCHYRDIAKPSVDFRRETVVAVEPDRKRVVTDAGRYDADFLVVALGADLVPDATPGFVEGAPVRVVWDAVVTAALILVLPERHDPHERRASAPPRMPE